MHDLLLLIQDYMLYGLCHLPPTIFTLVMVWIVLRYEDFKQHIHLFVVYGKSPLNEQVHNGGVVQFVGCKWYFFPF